MEPDEAVLYDIVAVRSANGGPTVRRVLAGPYDEIDARYHGKRLKAVSPDQNYIIVVHHVCRQCEYLTLLAPAESARLIEAEVRKEWDKAGEAFRIARQSDDENEIARAQAKIDELSAAGEVRAAEAKVATDLAKEMSEMGELPHTCTRYYDTAPAV